MFRSLLCPLWKRPIKETGIFSTSRSLSSDSRWETKLKNFPGLWRCPVEGGLSQRNFKVGTVLGDFSEQGPRPFSQVSFSSFSFPLLFFYVGSLLPSQVLCFLFSFTFILNFFSPSALLTSLSPLPVTFYQTQFGNFWKCSYRKLLGGCWKQMEHWSGV